MTELAHTPSATAISAATAAAVSEPIVDSIPPETLLIPAPSEAQRQAAALPLSEMAALLTDPALAPDQNDLELVEEESDAPSPAAPQRVSSQPPPLPSPRRVAAAPAAEERAQLHIEDLSLRMDNPYRASSLTPPAPRAQGVRKGFLLALAGALGGALLSFVGSGYVADLTRGDDTAVAAAASSVPASTHPSPLPSEPAPAVQQPATGEGPIEIPVVAPAVALGVPAGPDAPVATQPTASKAPRAKLTSKKSLSGARARGRKSRRNVPRKHTAPVASEALQVAIPAQADLPAAPPRQEILANFTRVRGELQRCADGQHGVADIRATILGDGRVSRPRVVGVFANTPASLCMERAVRNLTFEPFAQPRVSIAFPVAL